MKEIKNSGLPILREKVIWQNERTFWPQIYTTNIGMHMLLHDITRFNILFPEQLFLIFNQMLSIDVYTR